MYAELGFIAVDGGDGEQRLRLPALSAPPDRRLRHRERRAPERVLRRLSRTLRAGRSAQRLPDADDVLAKWMALRGDERELISAANMHLPGPPARPRPGAPRPAPAARVAGARGSGPLSVSAARGPRSSAVFDGPDRAAARAYMKGIGFDDEALSRPTIGVANTWIEAMPCNFHLRELAEHDQGGRPRGRRHADGVQHGRDLGRDHDGHRGDEDLAGQPRGDRRLDRADRARLPVRRRGRALGLRQDDPRLRDGAGPPRRPRA